MIKSKFFIRYFIIATSLSLLFFILVLLTAQSINKDFISDLPGQGQMRKMLETLSKVPPTERLHYLEENFISPRGMRPFEIFLCDNSGAVLFPKDQETQIDLNQMAGVTLFSFLFAKDDIKQIISLPDKPQQYLIFRISLDEAHSQIMAKRHKFITLLGVLIFALTLGIFTGLFLIFSLLRDRAKSLDYVINELHHGNLKARLPIKKMDEVGLMMSRFNLMADEIEKLVNSLSKAESTRKELLRELAHDLRTPIASMKNILEMSLEKKHLLAEEKKDELLSTALNEVEYFSSLVDDLLFLGQIKEPRYQEKIQIVSLELIAQEEIQQIKTRYPNIAAVFSSPPNSKSFNADEKLMRRLFRNLLENSFSFANSSINLTFRYKADQLLITITDDGPGFSPEALKEFGQKRSKRIVAETKNRISLGLGSVIMKSIVKSHDGTITPQNILNKEGKIIGAQVDATLIFY